MMIFDFIDDHPFVAAIVAIVVFVLVFTFVGNYLCKSRWEQSGYSSEWSVSTDCLVKVDNRWVPSETLKLIQ
jgi:hypothetical protein